MLSLYYSFRPGRLFSRDNVFNTMTEEERNAKVEAENARRKQSVISQERHKETVNRIRCKYNLPQKT